MFKQPKYIEGTPVCSKSEYHAVLADKFWMKEAIRVYQNLGQKASKEDVATELGTIYQAMMVRDIKALLESQNALLAGMDPGRISANIQQHQAVIQAEAQSASAAAARIRQLEAELLATKALASDASSITGLLTSIRDEARAYHSRPQPVSQGCCVVC